MYNIIARKKIWLSISSVLVISGIIALAVWGLDFGIDFTGGSLLEVEFKGTRPTVVEVQDSLVDLELGSLTVQPIGEKGMIIRFQNTEEDKHQKVLSALQNINQKNKDQDIKNAEGSVNLNGIEIDVENEGNSEIVIGGENQVIEELRYDSVGPSIGEELKRKSIYAIITVLIFIVLYIALVFRKVSKPVASWKYGVTAIIALFHDVIIVLGVFAVLGHFYNIEINTPFVAAILTVLGYSVNDTIVVFDRIRENLPKSEENFENTINISVNQTLTRSVYTSLTTLLVLLSILFFGGDTIKDFVLALSIGVFIGTYSSIFLASPVLVIWEKFNK